MKWGKDGKGVRTGKGEGRERGKDGKGGRTGKGAERGGRRVLKEERMMGGSGIG